MATMRFTKEHEWIRILDNVGTVGITEYAQEQLGDIVFVELPEVGSSIEQGSEAAVVESVKAASEVYAPAGGEVTEVNERLADEPDLVNSSAEGDGWFFRVRLSDASQVDGLMDAAAYREYLASLE